MKASIGPLLVRLDPAERDPLQVQLYTSIRGAILDGVLTPGAKLPSSRELATDLGVSRTTAVLAFDRLAAEGYIEARAGSGTFVTLELPAARVSNRHARARRVSAATVVTDHHPAATDADGGIA
jgi:GntR family transcriptional regulator/MocR family aminotransferase